MLIVYRRSDGLVASNSGTNSFMPEGPPFELEVRNAIAVYGGVPDDYGEYRLHDERDAEIVAAILDSGSYSLVFDDEGQPIGVNVYPRIEVSASAQEVDPGEEVVVTASVPEDTDDMEVRFFVEDEGVAVAPIAGGVASHTFVFPDPGVYYIGAESDRHGRWGVEVIVRDEVES